MSENMHARSQTQINKHTQSMPNYTLGFLSQKFVIDNWNIMAIDGNANIV